MALCSLLRKVILLYIGSKNKCFVGHHMVTYKITFTKHKHVSAFIYSLFVFHFWALGCTQCQILHLWKYSRYKFCFSL